MPLYQQPHWSVELPEGWHGEREGEGTLFRRDGGAGTLEVTLLCGNEPVTQEMLLELSSSTREEGHTPGSIQAGNCTGLYFSYREEDTAWREWYLAAGQCVFFVSYDCPRGDETTEAADVDIIVAGLTLKQ